MTLMLRVRAIDETGAPVAGALVRTDDETAATTDADGVAIVSGIDTGFAMVTVSHSMPAEAQLIFSLGEGSSGIIERTVTLRCGAPLRGTVVAPDGSPMPDAILEVWSAIGTRHLEADAEGHWCVPAMLAGPYEVRAAAAGYARGPAIFGTHDGNTEQHGVIVRVATGARLHGRIRDSAGQPVAGVGVYTEMQPGDDRSTSTDSAGRFEILGLGAGRHHISVGGWTSSVVLPGDGGEHELDIELPEPTPAADPSPARPMHSDAPAPAQTATLTGRVLRDGAPASHFVIVRKGVSTYHWSSEPATIQALDGRFELTGLRESSCTVHVLALGSAWASTDTLVLQPGSTLDLGDVVLPRGLKIAGTIYNASGDPISGARVTIGSPRHDDDPLSDAVDGNFGTVSGSDGAFLFDGVHVGDPRLRNRLSASHPQHGASLEQPLSGSDETIRLILLPTGSIVGEIEPHSAMLGAVIVRAEAPEAGGRVATVRPSGVFEVENIVPGEYRVELVQRPRWPRREARATVVAGQCTRVRIPPP